MPQCAHGQVDITESILQVFIPSIVVRQQAFTALGAEPSVQQEVRVPAEWQLASNNSVSLAIGAGKKQLLKLLVFVQHVKTAISLDRKAH